MLGMRPRIRRFLKGLGGHHLRVPMEEPQQRVRVLRRQGRLALGGYDGLDVPWVGTSLPQSELDHLVDAGIIEKPID